MMRVFTEEREAVLGRRFAADSGPPARPELLRRGEGPEDRKTVAHGASRGFTAPTQRTSPGGAQDLHYLGRQSVPENEMRPNRQSAIDLSALSGWISRPRRRIFGP